MNIKVLKYKENIINEITNLVLKSNEIENNLIVFPGKRPSYFLLKEIHKKINKTFIKPDTFSIDNFIEHFFQKIYPNAINIKTIDAIALIFNLFKKNSSLFKNLSLDVFMGWGTKIYSDFEELKMNNITRNILQYFDYNISQELPINITQHLSSFSQIYNEFYQYIKNNSLSTRAYRYQTIAENINSLLKYFQSYENIIFAGFFGLSKNEIQIFQQIGKSLNNSLFIFQEGPGISTFLKQFSYNYTEPNLLIHNNINLYKATENHKQIFFLNSLLTEDRTNINTSIILPDSSMLFPILFNTTTILKNDFNISMGYPLNKTPIFSLMKLLEQLIINKIDNRIFINDYIRFIMHPYIKNITHKNNSSISRIIVHTFFEFYKKSRSNLIELEQILTKELLQQLKENLQTSGITEEEIIKIIEQIHNICIKPFFDIININDFTTKIHNLIIFIFEYSTAWQHPYSQNVMEIINNTLKEIYKSQIRKEKFENIEKYFKLIESLFNNFTFKLPGTPLKGLQILGFLETRNLYFKNLYILNTNEKKLPVIKNNNTILNDFIRKKLGLSTSKDTEDLIKYYFFSLINNSENVNLFYIENSNNEKSRFIEQIIWELQKQNKSEKINITKEIEYPITFKTEEPNSKKKNNKIIRRLLNIKFSPTALDTYLACPIKFYYRYVLNIKQDHFLENEENIQQNEIGSIVHKILKELFFNKKNISFHISDQDYKLAEKFIESIFIEKFKSIEGEAYLIYIQVKNRIFDILNYYREKMNNRKILYLEKNLAYKFTINSKYSINLKGFIDRIDIDNNKIIILDYKTSSHSNKNINILYKTDNFEEIKKHLNTIQLPFYIMLSKLTNIITNNNEFDAAYVLLNKKEIEEQSIFKQNNKKETDFQTNIDIQNKMENFIINLIEEILNPDIDFYPSEQYKTVCPNCEFKILCNRQWLFPIRYRS